MLDDHRGRLVELLGQLERRVGVEKVVEADLGVAGHELACADGGLAGPGLFVQSRGLVRVLAVAERRLLRQSEGDPIGELDARLGVEVLGDRGVVAGGQRECRPGQVLPQFAADGSVVVPHLLNNSRILIGTGDDGDEFMILGRGADHAGTADIDILDGLFDRAAGLGHGLLEGIEIHADQVDRVDAVLVHRLHVLGLVAQGQQAAVDFGVQCFDPTVHHLRETRDRVDGDDFYARLRETFGGAAGADDLDAHLGEHPGEIDHSRLVRDAEERCLDRDIHLLILPVLSEFSGGVWKRGG